MNRILKPSLSTAVDNALALPNICMSWIMLNLSYQSATAPKVDDGSSICFGDSTLNSYQSGIFGPSHGVVRWNIVYDTVVIETTQQRPVSNKQRSKPIPNRHRCGQVPSNWYPIRDTQTLMMFGEPQLWLDTHLYNRIGLCPPWPWPPMTNMSPVSRWWWCLTTKPLMMHLPFTIPHTSRFLEHVMVRSCSDCWFSLAW